MTLAACGANGPNATSDQMSAAPAHGSFLGRLSNGVIYVEWTSTTSGLAGHALHGPSPAERRSTRDARDRELGVDLGTVAGNSINLSLASGANVNGTLSGANLILAYPVNQPGQIGTIVELPMDQASTGEYHRALAALRNTVKAANEAVADGDRDWAGTDLRAPAARAQRRTGCQSWPLPGARLRHVPVRRLMPGAIPAAGRMIGVEDLT